jgi:hypothetical protein
MEGRGGEELNELFMLISLQLMGAEGASTNPKAAQIRKAENY